MRKILFLLLVAVAAGQINAANVDFTTAQNKARSFMNGLHQSGRLMAASPNVSLLYAEKSDVKVNEPVFYVFADGNGFVIVAGDDRAEEILAYGDSQFDVNNMPCNMRAWLNMYKKQIEYLQEHPGLKVEKTSRGMSFTATEVVAPLLTAEWNQTAPYWNQCPSIGGSRCYTGCPATSLAQVFYFWKYPTAPTPAVPAYRYRANIWSSWTNVPALPSTTFDWMNMKDTYRSYSSAQANAVATLMRYVGQAEHMEYGTSGSGIAGDSVILITNAVKFYGYQTSARNISKSNYTDSRWRTYITTELDAGRPIVYCAQDDNGGGGHAFNVDGYDSDGKFHINWGWSGAGNAYYALNAFNDTYGTGNFNTYQQMVIGIQPPYQGPDPVLSANPESVSFRAEPGDTVTQTFILQGTNMRQGVTLTLSGNTTQFSISPTTLTAEEATAGAPITVTYMPKGLVTSTATITAKSLGAEDLTVSVTGVGVRIPVITVEPAALDFTAEVDERVSQSFVVKGRNLTGDLSLEVVDDTEDFYIDKVFILKNGANSENGVTVFATYYPADFGEHSARVVISGGGAEPAEVQLTGFATLPKAIPVMKPASPVYITLNSFLAEWTDETPSDFVNSYTLWMRRSGASAVTYTGIPDKSYMLENLVDGATYTYKVKAVYTDGTESTWSNTESVTLTANSHPYEMGDVNHDGQVGIADVSALIDFLLNSNAPACAVCADLSGNGIVDIADVSALIDFLLSM